LKPHAQNVCRIHSGSIQRNWYFLKLKTKGFSLVKKFLNSTTFDVVASARNEQTFLESSSSLPPNWKSRLSFVPIDITSEDSIKSASAMIQEKYGQKCLKVVVNSSGFLLPDKSVKTTSLENLQAHFAVNTFGPLLVGKHFSTLLAPPQKGLEWSKPVWVNISAKTGSITDNKLGGWYSYRMSKAALNQFTRTFAVEMGKRSIVISLHPGTVDTDLSRPYVKNVPLTSPDQCAENLFQVLKSLDDSKSGSFLDYQGNHLPF
jgi:NAD(P)-dependent dehydrogenase (short-subunit alcohol dehydrogenase family)